MGKVCLGLIGYPLEHSLSPRLHTAAMKTMGLEGEYRLFPISPLPDGKEQLLEIIQRARDGDISGLNVTIPHKQNVIPHLNELSPVAIMIGAVNTIISRSGYLLGDNTDATAFLCDLKRVIKTAPGKAHLLERDVKRHALMMGAGGSARAVGFALVQDGWKVTIAARSLEKAHALLDSITKSGSGSRVSLASNIVENQIESTQEDFQRLQAIQLHAEILEKMNENIDLVVNTTPVGMWPDVDENPWPQGVQLSQRAIVYDLVYNPAQTALVKAARSAGLIASTGIGMLIEQAALSLERWVEKKVPRQAMWKALPQTYQAILNSGEG